MEMEDFSNLFDYRVGHKFWERSILLIESQLMEAAIFFGSNERYIQELQNDTNFALVL